LATPDRSDAFLAPVLREPDARWILSNRRTASAIATTVECAFDSRSRNRGLLGRDALATDTAFILAPCNAIHTFFMRFPIDLAFIDRAGTIVSLTHGVRPWRMRICLRAFATIELASGTLARHDVRRLDVLALTSL
jgi:uncharacterized membrane protein (UPF0127 family)